MEESYCDFKQEDYENVVPMSIETELKDELCQIMYTDEYKLLMGIVRSMLSANELSPRAMRLTSKVIDIAPAFYTVWNYRYNVFVHIMGKVTDDQEKKMWCKTELDWLDEVTLNNPKNYQIWSYRQSILSNVVKKPSLSTESAIMSMMIDEDSKNYHVWSYRKWLVKFVGDYSQELSFIDHLIQRDVYNNSAWSHRMFYWKNINPDTAMIDEEINYVKDKITLVPQNISTWNYLRGIYKTFKSDKYDSDIIEFVSEFTSNVIAKDDLTKDDLPEIQSSYALECLAYIYSLNDTNKGHASCCYKYLALKYDPIRSNYWNHRIELLAK